MNKLFTKKMRTLVFLGTMGALSLTLAAKPALKTVKAYVNPAISYTLNGEKVLADSKILTYDNKTYVPLADVAKLLGLQTQVSNNTISLTASQLALPASVTTAPVTTDSVIDVTPIPADAVVVPKATIKEVQADAKTVTILKDGTEDKTENYIVLNISDATKIINQADQKAYALTDLKAGTAVAVKYSNVTTTSAPTQFAAYEITVLDPNAADKDQQEVKTEKVALKGVKIAQVSNSGKYIVLEGQDLKIAFGNKTKIKFEGAKKLPNANSLKAGLIVDIEFEKTVSKDTTTAKIVSITVKEQIAKKPETKKPEVRKTETKKPDTKTAAVNAEKVKGKKK